MNHPKKGDVAAITCLLDFAKASRKTCGQSCLPELGLSSPLYWQLGERLQRVRGWGGKYYFEVSGKEAKTTTQLTSSVSMLLEGLGGWILGSSMVQRTPSV